jgi:hypothetical protein
MSVALIQRLVVAAAALLLAACAGTIQRESNAGSGRIAGANYSAVDIVLSEQARRAQGDNPLFNATELGDYVRRRLEGRDLLSPQATHRVEITIEHVRVRSVAAAVILGFMAGADEINGFVRVYDARGRQVHGYKVNASYALGGYAGGQDSMRMNWLYNKFSELAVAELAGATSQETVAKGRAYPSTVTPAMSITPAGAAPVGVAPAEKRAAVPQAAAAPAAQPARIASGFAAIDDIDAVPYLSDRGRKGYSEWLARPTPKAFAISTKGNWYATWGVSPPDASLPIDPGERALQLCERAAQVPCKLYAVNGSVVWTKEAP